MAGVFTLSLVSVLLAPGITWHLAQKKLEVLEED